MKIAEFSVKNYQFTLIIFVLLLALGLNSLFNMPRGEDPETTAPSFVVIVVYPGTRDRKSTRLNSSHLVISYAVFCLKKKIPVDSGSVGCSIPAAISWDTRSRSMA